MRYHLLLLGFSLFLSHSSATAQGFFTPAPLERFPSETGHYVLVDRRQGECLIDYEPTLNPRVIIQLPHGQKIKFRPHEVVSFTLANRLFISTSESAETPTPENAEEFVGDFVQ